MDAFVESLEPQQASGADERDAGAEYDEKGRHERNERRELRGMAHSITSPRIRNFASATVATKPSMPITSAASK